MTNLLRKARLSAFLLLLSAAATAQNNELTLIPSVQTLTQNKGTFVLRNNTSWNVAGDPHLTNYLKDKYKSLFGCDPTIVEKKADVTMELIADPSLADEGYRLTVSDKKIVIKANRPAGLFYGLQTMLQMLPPEALTPAEHKNEQKWSLANVDIVDKPQFPWRGLMLDVSRHWFTKEEVKKYIDQLSTYKMNVFHWHLTDDQGWRIEIPQYPNLTKKGAWRAQRVGEWWQRFPQEENEAADYGGYYTEEDIKEVLAYAADRFVRVIPEVDVPGHSLAALVSYPELACMNAPKYVNVGNKFYGTDENSLCVGNPYTYEFLDNVFDEIVRLFPDEYIHIGGDECFKGFWAKCPKCQDLKHTENIPDENGLQSYFIKRIEALLVGKGKKIIGWDEISEGGLAPEATVMSWRGMSGGIEAAQAGHAVIMTPTAHCYFDLYQGENTVEPRTYSICRLSDVYNFNPVPEGVDPALVLGSQGNLWSEMVPTFHHAEYMTWPRGWALSEVLWSGSQKTDWPDFVTRVEHHFERAQAAGIHYAKSMYNAVIDPYFAEDGKMKIEIYSEIPDLDIYYTFDNTDPDTHGPRYTSELSIPKDATMLRVVTYRKDKPIGKVISLTMDELKERAKNTNRKVGNL